MNDPVFADLNYADIAKSGDSLNADLMDKNDNEILPEENNDKGNDKSKSGDDSSMIKPKERQNRKSSQKNDY